MKNMKKLVSVLLTLVMALALAVPALARRLKLEDRCCHCSI